MEVSKSTKVFDIFRHVSKTFSATFLDQIIYLMYVIDAVGFNAEVYRLKLDDFALLLCKDIYIRADSPMPYWECC